MLHSVIEKCLDKDPGQRYHSGGEVRAALEAAATASRSERIPVAALRPAFDPRAAKAQRRMWYALAAFVLAFGVVAVFLVEVQPSARRSGPLPGAIQSVAVLPLEIFPVIPRRTIFPMA